MASKEGGAMAGIDGNRPDGGGAPGADGEPMEPSNPKGFSGREGAAVTTPPSWKRGTRGRTGVTEGWSVAGRRA